MVTKKVKDGAVQPDTVTGLIADGCLCEDDAELRSLTVALLEDEQLDAIECESAEAVTRAAFSIKY